MPRVNSEVLAPGCHKRDLSGKIEHSIIWKMCEMGLLGTEMPEKCGGSGLDWVIDGIVIEAITCGDFNEDYMPLLVLLNGQIIAQHALPELTSE
ncbi:acyl-CoA dehydrogenase family protein [Pseudomonas sp. MAFF 311095]|uniref:Acyl-CoA dehydrogenase family protein n=2 Tax=Pseudomonas TaxID=286 RepID=A0ABS8QQ71_9PSED|nr:MULTISPECIES: acyl-CoA dehydrogenase family protein [Pseudomonas]MCD7037671.1 acyl-CoA dehydrogenase family protein [Pseudomonas petroselini]MCD7046934.1 acyl-CoA dehydrogenase family protein [Pseudomonas petroselini]MCD7066520.1 acyl-CoA dehydrogenase family protein [Pseudomonas petroselini]MCD7080103.1 acyl-CoA dehydrogenase family protein [Pseudomonas petroselini]MCM2380433.1 acyl-CoA dehydrogenase family protein [Pseudomonas marginalis]